MINISSKISVDEMVPSLWRLEYYDHMAGIICLSSHCCCSSGLLIFVCDVIKLERRNTSPNCPNIECHIYVVFSFYILVSGIAKKNSMYYLDNEIYCIPLFWSEYKRAFLKMGCGISSPMLGQHLPNMCWL